MIARSRAQPEVLVQEHVGRLTVKKNIRFLVDLEQSLVQSGLITSRFPVAGQGAEEPRLKANLRRADFTGAAHRVVVNHSTATGTGAVKGRPMGNLRRRNISTTIVVLGLVLASWMAAAQQAPEAVQKSPLPLEQVVRNLEERNAARTVALRQFEGKRVYRMEYRGFPSNRDAEMVVKVSFRGPKVQVFFGNRSIFTAEDSGILTAGKTGLWAKGANGASFDDFRIDKKS